MLEPTQELLRPLDGEKYSPQSPIRSLSYSCAVDRAREKVFRLPQEDVRAGLQANLRFFILHSAAVFLVEEDEMYLDKQVTNSYLSKHTVMFIKICMYRKLR